MVSHEKMDRTRNRVIAGTQRICSSWLPGFVQTDGTQFLLDGSTFYYAGTNNYYLNFKPQYEVDQVMEDAAAMGLKVIRTWGNLDAGVKTDKVNKDGYVHQQLGSIRRDEPVCKVGTACR